MKINFVLLFSMFFYIKSFAQMDSTFCYSKNGEGVESIKWFYFFEKYFSYRTFDNQNIENEYISNSPYVKSIKQLENNTFFLEFTDDSPESERHIITGIIRSSENFDISPLIHSSSKTNDFSNFSQTDDLLLICFRDSILSENELSNFVTRNNLIVRHVPSPSLPKAMHTYTFSIQRDSLKFDNSIDVARKIYERENGFTYIVEANSYYFNGLLQGFPNVFTGIENYNYNYNFFPNPSSGAINVVANENSKLVVEDFYGRIIDEKELFLSKTELNYSHLKAGIYYFTILRNEHVIDRKKVIFK
jgi:hypothetical protein